MKRLVTRMILFLLLCLPGGPALAGAAAVSGHTDSINEEQIQKLQDRMLSDSQVMALIAALRDDPDLQVLLNDPSFMQAISARDINTLTNDPRFMKLFSNPLIKKIIERME